MASMVVITLFLLNNFKDKNQPQQTEIQIIKMEALALLKLHLMLQIIKTYLWIHTLMPLM